MKTKVYHVTGEEAGTMEVSDAIFSVSWNNAVVSQVYRGEQQNVRRPWAHVKTRGEVRGGGKKPWRQKGLGRARHGSIRSPIWIGGGVTHGPRNERNYHTRINAKMKRAALKALLSRKMKDNELICLDSFTLPFPKTKEASFIFKNLRTRANFPHLGEKGGKTLLALAHTDIIGRFVRNLPYVDYIEPRNVFVSALLHHKYVVFDSAAIKEVEKILSR